MRTKERSRRSKKNRTALLLLLIAFIILTGASLAYFSDFITGTITGTVGTLDLTATAPSMTRYYTQGGTEASDTGTTIANLNPGDIVEINYGVTNQGNKSAWVREILTLTVGENYDDVQQLPDEFAVYASTATNADIRSGAATPLTTTAITNGFQIISGNTIINGTGTGAETESGVTTNATSAAYKIYFKTTALNSYQETDVTFAMRTEAIQYRNNTTANWATITTTEFSL